MNLKFREYRKSDLETCAKLSKEAWQFVISLLKNKNQVNLLMKAFVEMCVILSDWLYVATVAETNIDEKVVGFLFGRVKIKHNFIQNIIESLKLIRLEINLFFGKFGKLRRPFSILKKELHSYFYVESKCSKMDSEVNLFVVDKEFRGNGIGRSLMNKFLDYAKSNKAKSVYLITDDKCNWKFYEKYGFNVLDVFPNKLVPNEKNVNNYIFVKVIE